MHAVTTRLRRLAALAASFLAVAAIALVGTGLAPAPALAVCNPATCGIDPQPKPSPPPPPSSPAPAIYTISSQSGFSGDTVTLTGTNLAGATVTFGGAPAASVTGASTQLVAVAPPLGQFNGITIPVAVTTQYGSASIGFKVTTLLKAGVSTTFGADGSAQATAVIDRLTGFGTLSLTVNNMQWLASLSVDASLVLIDGAGVVRAFTTPDTVTTSGVAWASFGMGIASTTDLFAHDPIRDLNLAPVLDPSTAPIRSAQIVLTRDSLAELSSVLDNAVKTGQTIASLVAELAQFAG